MKKIKAWAVYKKGKIKHEDFYVKDYMKGKASLAIFTSGPEESGPMWGYALPSKGEKAVQVWITPIAPKKKTKTS